jgi:phosphomevalonate kinase
VEYAVQYSVAAAYATFDQNKKDALHKLLLQGIIVFFFSSALLINEHATTASHIF